MKKLHILAALLAVLTLCACGKAPVEAEPVDTSDLADFLELVETDAPAAEGYDALGGVRWQVGAVYNAGKIYDVNDNKNLADLYDTESYTFREDGTYFNLDLFPEEGTYQPFGEEGGFLLKRTACYKFDSETGELVDNPQPSGRTLYLDILDENTIAIATFDAALNKTEDDWLIYVRPDTTSDYIATHKVTIAQ